VSDLNISNVLSQIRSLREQAGALRPVAPAASPVQQATKAQMPAFGDVLKGAVERVNGAQVEASRMQEAFQLGDPRADLPAVMLSMQKSSVSFRALVEVRNRVVQAYQDVMNMPM
jgi:flagellar hook-basal body complex protein FliE